MKLAILAIAALVSQAHANPYPDPRQVAKISVTLSSRLSNVLAEGGQTPGLEVLRVLVDWLPGEKFEMSSLTQEFSGTPALYRASQRPDSLGSYQGGLFDAQTGAPLAFDAVGTGKEYRRLTRALSFRFPMPKKSVIFRMAAENPNTGKMEMVLEKMIDPKTATKLPTVSVISKLILAAASNDKLLVNIYSEGYTASRQEAFFQHAQYAAAALKQAGFPGLEHFQITAVFAPSKTALGTPASLGDKIPERDSFLGLYFAYWWNPKARWYDVLYPTREKKLRDGLGQVAHDYAIVLVDDKQYWGIGNFRAYTAIPGDPTYNTAYLLLHEFGHFFGLNEEYEGGGPTELEFAPGVQEPWSQNITFLNDPKKLKWGDLVTSGLPVPTPETKWKTGDIGAFLGGYADSPPLGHSHKPGFHCTMEDGAKFCPVCQRAIRERVNHDLGSRL